MTGALLTPTEAAEYLGRSRAFVQSLIADDLVHAKKHRGRWYITKASIDAWLNEGQPEPERPERLYQIPGVVRPKGQRDGRK